jgi:signal transduction histidine kinase
LENRQVSILVKLRNSFTIVISVLLTLVLLSSYLLNRAISLYKADTVLVKLEHEIQALEAEEAMLTTPSLVDTMLFVNPASFQQKHVEDHRLKIENLLGILEEQFGSNESLLKFDSIRVLRDSYFETFDSLSVLVNQRGFKDYGLEGEMRHVAHFIEDSLVNIDAAQILMLRRHEKDFLLRGDTVYVGKFRSQVQSILRNEILSDSDRFVLDRYYILFEELADLDLSIGRSDSSGLKGNLSRNHQRLNVFLSDLHIGVEERVNSEILNVFAVFGISVLIAILVSILLSMRLSSSIGVPVKNLSKEIYRFEIEDIVQHKKLEVKSSIKEVTYLVRSFNNLLEMLRKQLELVDTKTKELQERNQELNNREIQLKQSNSVKDKFFSIIAHDMRGPIGGMLVFLESLNEDIDTMKKPELKDFARAMLGSATQLANLMENLLQWSKSQMGMNRPEFRQVILRESAEKSMALFANRLKEKNISLAIRISHSHIVVADQNMVDFVFRNVISNAIKFTKKKGEIVVDSEQIGRRIQVSVRDNGIGISEENQKKLFQETEQHSSYGTANEKGTGLGLLLSKEFVTKNHGEIWVKSELDIGTTVFFTFSIE